MLDGALGVPDLDPVAHLEGLIDDDGDRPEEVLDRVLRGERDREAPDAQPGEQGQHLDVERVGDVDQPERGDEDLDRLPQQRDQQVVELGVGLARLRREERGDEIGEAERGPDRGDHHDDAHRDEQHQQRPGGEAQQLERPVPQRAPREQPERAHGFLEQVAVLRDAALPVDARPDAAEHGADDVVDRDAHEDDGEDPDPLPDLDVEDGRLAERRGDLAAQHHRGREGRVGLAEVRGEALDIAVERVEARDGLVAEMPFPVCVLLEDDRPVGQARDALVLGEAVLGEVGPALVRGIDEEAHEVAALDQLDPVEHLEHLDRELALERTLGHPHEVEARERLVEGRVVALFPETLHRVEVGEHRLFGCLEALVGLRGRRGWRGLLRDHSGRRENQERDEAAQDKAQAIDHAPILVKTRAR